MTKITIADSVAVDPFRPQSDDVLLLAEQIGRLDLTLTEPGFDAETSAKREVSKFVDAESFEYVAKSRAGQIGSSFAEAGIPEGIARIIEGIIVASYYESFIVAGGFFEEKAKR